ncbi:hypothetical protein HYALB_00005772 [Hymenoscyphus albidus]|uniref:Uncharacterized protein n=1 Tax=Hymenoscyphus albidus TaxID=595503 RepID=A0A9N9LRE8_9HELO|nr:hypothetical protein HYALB_00005772 [Hymenoscyphus albidus]
MSSQALRRCCIVKPISNIGHASKSFISISSVGLKQQMRYVFLFRFSSPPVPPVRKLRSTNNLILYDSRHATSTTNPKPAVSVPPTFGLAPSKGIEILAAQRRQRPVAPHLQIYKWQITSVLSSLERITGATLAGALYIFGTAYFVSPYLGWDLSSEALVAAMAGLPMAVKFAVKSVLAWPFLFHFFNSLRHLGWDLGKGFKKVVIVRTGYVAVALSFLATTGCALWF